MIDIEGKGSLVSRIPEMLGHIECHDEYIDNNTESLEIFEGDLIDKVKSILNSTLSNEYYNQIKDRVLPINFMPKMIGKMAQTYSTPPKRSSDVADFVENYEKYLDLDSEMSIADEYANLHKGYSLEPFVSRGGKPSVRAIPYNKFLVIGDDHRDRKEMTVYIKFMGTFPKEIYCEKEDEVSIVDTQWYIAYSDTEIVAFDTDSEQRVGITEKANHLNEIGKIPFIYGNRSKQRLIPKQDTDLSQMIKMFAVLFSDLGGAVMFQCFSIMFGVDIDTKDLKMSPNAFWDLKSLPNSEKKPEVGTITPQAQVDKVLNFIATVLGAWAESRDIKIGSVGKMDSEQAASGVAKIIDNMDTVEVRRKSIPFFRKEEKDLWHLLALMNNHWIKTGEINTELYPVSTVDVSTIRKSFKILFVPPKPIIDVSEVIDNQIKLIEKRLTTRPMAIREINQDMDDTAVDKLIVEIDDEDEAGFDDEENNDNNNETDLNNNKKPKEDDEQ